MIQDTSLNAYREYVKPKLGDRQRIVYEMLKMKGDLTNSELSEKLGWRINEVTPRVYELRQLNLVEDSGKRKCKVSGLIVHSWRISPLKTEPQFKNTDATIRVYSEDNQLQLI